MDIVSQQSLQPPEGADRPGMPGCECDQATGFGKPRAARNWQIRCYFSLCYGVVGVGGQKLKYVRRERFEAGQKFWSLRTGPDFLIPHPPLGAVL